MKKEFIIYTKMLSVTLWLFEKVNTFPKSQRFILGQQIENSALSCLRAGDSVIIDDSEDTRVLNRIGIDFMLVNQAVNLNAHIDTILAKYVQNGSKLIH